VPTIRQVVARSIVALAGALALALVLGLFLSPFFTHNGPTGVDASVLRWFTGLRTPAWNQVMRRVTWLGSGIVVVPLTIAVAMALVLGRRTLLAIFVAVAVAGAALVNWIAKSFVNRSRPAVAVRLQHPHASSFPSGHSVQAAATYVAVAVVVASLTRAPTARGVASTVCALLVFAVGISRVYLGVHWATDVIAGWLVGSACAVGLAVAFGILRVQTRHIAVDGRSLSRP
jgi:undecaprenyl-diphosphatase